MMSCRVSASMMLPAAGLRRESSAAPAADVTEEGLPVYHELGVLVVDTAAVVHEWCFLVGFLFKQALLQWPVCCCGGGINACNGLVDSVYERRVCKKFQLSDLPLCLATRFYCNCRRALIIS